ncbi:MAG TPA: OmpH family outer membrane protein [Bacteroides sp.]|nr:OmpH family outer membrane protein [Bacteroides sp.]
MKNIIKLFLVVVILMGGLTVNAQELKFGHIDSRELLMSMPESDSAQTKIQKLGEDYQQQVEEMRVEMNKKYDDYINNQETWTDLIKQTKEADLQDMQQRVGQFEQMAQQDLQTQQQEMMRPILEKANNAVKEVAQENGFIYIFDIGSGNPVFWSDQSIDILSLVKTKLGN